MIDAEVLLGGKEDDGSDSQDYPHGQLTEDKEADTESTVEDGAQFKVVEENSRGAEVIEEEEFEEEEIIHQVLTEQERKPVAEENEEVEGGNPFAAVLDDVGGLLFSDGSLYERAPVIKVPDSQKLSPAERKGIWKLLELHERFFQEHPHRRFIPHLLQEINLEQFHQTFRLTSTAVVIPFAKMRHLGFTTRSWTLEQLQEKFPFDPTRDKQILYKPRSNGYVDLGPAVYALSQNEPLKKQKGRKRNFPRNMMVAPKYLKELGVVAPPFVEKRRFQVPTMWFGTATSDTKFHHDCCDNFVMMISGTKRWYIAPPSDAAHLRPIKCEGSNQALCWASVQYPNKQDIHESEKEKLNRLNSIVVDLKAGEMLYLPAGWWHHIENLGPTVMVNWWTMGCENSAVALNADPFRNDRPDFAGKCPAVKQASDLFRQQNSL